MANSRIVEADAEGLQAAAELIKRNDVCAFPTETVYGLGGNAFSDQAVRRIYDLKRRPAGNPLIVHISQIQDAYKISDGWSDVAEKLAGEFWPGPMTLVVRRAAAVSSLVSAGQSSVAVRVPAHPIARQLLDLCELPVAAPSANRSTAVSPTRAEHVLRSLPDVPLVLDGGPCRWGIESTVIDVLSPRPRILRPGAIGVERIREVVGFVDSAPETDGPQLSPGLAKKHYSPSTPLRLVPELSGDALETLPASFGLLTHEPPPDDVAAQASHVELLPGDPAGYGARLYDAMHHLDDLGVGTIIVLSPPQDEGWIAIRDRLGRAAADGL